MEKVLVTVVTPTYNRAGTLPALYESLRKQTDRRFDWLIVDDGSSDDTEDVVRRFERNLFEIRYTKKENGGKHTALNLAFDIVESELIFIVDSDDVLTPDAIGNIYEDWAGVRDKDLCGIGYLRGRSATEVIGSEYPAERSIDNFIALRFNRRCGGDKAEVWRTDLCREQKFPVVEGERFMGESILWVRLAREHDMLFVNKIVYITKYLPGGLTKSGRRMRNQNPMGYVVCTREWLGPEFSLRGRIKFGMLYVCYSLMAKRSLREIFSTEHNGVVALTLLPGALLCAYWLARYGR